MNKDIYILELNAEQALLLYAMIKSGNWKNTSFEPFRELVNKVDIMYKDIKHDLVNN